MSKTPRSFVLLALLAVLVSACAVPAPVKKPEPPPITEQMLRERATEQLAAGQKHYEAGEYDAAVKSFNGALEHGLLPRSDQSTARKYLAFIACVSNRETQCRDEFRRALEIDPAFDLSPAEAGHPNWGPVFRSVKAQLEEQRAAIAARNAPPLAKAEQALADGMKKYEAGDYEGAAKLLQEAGKEGLKDKSDQVKSLKFAAFSSCLTNKVTLCRNEFARIFDIDPAFGLTPAEAGHPSWGKPFVQAKAQWKQEQDKAAREARAKAAKEKLPTASVPAKKP
jgi:tetratricopeptide (TPR) repeat protein